MPYPFPSAGLYYQNGTGIVAALYRGCLDVVVDFGAVGNGIADDYQPITTAFNVASVSGVPVYLPPVNALNARSVFGTNQTLKVPRGVTLLGDAQSAVYGPVVRALSTMREVISVANIDQNITLTPTPSTVSRIVIDGNFKALYGLTRLGDWLSLYDNLCVGNCLLDGIHGATHSQPVTFSAVTASVPGGSPAGVSFSAWDATYSAQIAIAPATTTLVVKMSDATHYVASFDGGASFATAAQNLVAGGTSRIAYAQGPAYNYETGVAVTFPPGPYFAGDKWTVTAQQPQEAGGNQYLIEAQTKFRDPFIRNCGAIYASTPTLVGQLSGICPVGPFLQGGTVTTDPSTKRILGTSTTFLTGPAGTSGRFPRTGDFVWIAGATPPQAGLFPIATVQDDLVISVPQGCTLPSLAGVAYALFLGAGWRTEDNGDDSNAVMEGGQIDNIPTGIRSCGDSFGALTVRDTVIEGLYGAAGMSLGGIVVATTAQSLYSPESKLGNAANTVGCSVEYYVAPGSRATLYSPRRNTSSALYYGGPGVLKVLGTPSFVTSPGADANVATNEPINALILIRNDQTLTLVTDQIALPSTAGTIQAGSLVFVTLTGNLTLTSAAPIVTPTIDGLCVKIVVVSAFTLTIPNAGNNTRAPAGKAIAQYQSATYWSRGGLWIAETPQ